MNKNVWLINQHIDSPYLNGDGHRHHFIAEQLNKKGYNVTLITCSDTHVPKKSIKFNGSFKLIKGDNYDILLIKTNKYKDAISFGRIYSMFQFTWKMLFIPYKKVQKPDYIIVSSLSLPPLLSGLYYKKKFKSQAILEIRDIWPLSVIELGGYSKYHPLLLVLAFIEKIGYKKYDYLVSLLPKANIHFKDVLGHNKFQFQHISNGISLSDLEANKELGKLAKSKINPTKFNIGYAGSLGEANAMEHFVKAAIENQNSNIHFYIVGDGYLKNDLQLICNGDFSKITFIDKIPKNQVADLLQHFDVLYLSWKKIPIYRFGVSANKLFDYMYAGKPIIQSGDIADDPIGLSNCGLVVEPENHLVILEAVNKLYGMSSEELERMGSNGKEYVLANFTYSKLSDKYINIFKELSN